MTVNEKRDAAAAEKVAAAHGIYLAQWFLAETEEAKRDADVEIRKLEADHPWLAATMEDRLRADLKEALDYLAKMRTYSRGISREFLIQDVDKFLRRMKR